MPVKQPNSFSCSFVTITLAALLLAALSPVASGHEASLLGLHAHEPSVSAAWVSQYNSEGRDNLEDGGIFWGEASIGLGPVDIAIAHGIADSDNYQEFGATIEAGWEFQGLEGYLGYTRLEFTQDDESDNEFGAGIAWPDMPWFTPGLDAVWSTEAEGAFVEVSASRDFDIQEGFTISGSAIQAFDLGYATDSFDGPNHFQVGLEATWQLETLSLSVYGAHAIAGGDVERDGGDDETWAGVSVSYDL